MCKKVLVVALVAVGVVAGLNFSRVRESAGEWNWSWGKSSRSWARVQAKLEKDIDRLRKKVDALEDEDRVLIDKVARQRLEVKAADERLTKGKAELARLSSRITDLRAALKSKGADNEFRTVAYNGADYSREDAEKQMNADFDRYKPLKTGMAAQEKGLAALRVALEQNESALFGGKQRRTEMMTQIQELENELGEIRAARAASGTKVGVSPGEAKVQGGIDALKARLGLEREKVTVEGKLGNGPIEKVEAAKAQKAARELEIEAEFGLKK